MSGHSTGTLVLAALLGTLAAVGLVLVVYALTRPAPPPVAPPAGSGLPEFACSVVEGDEGRRTDCRPRTAEEINSSDPLKTAPTVTAPAAYPDEIVVGDNGPSDDLAACILARLQAEFSPEEFERYAAGEDGPRAADWQQVTLRANEECR